MSEIKKPNLFVVGFPKSGTTSLINYLSQHSDVYFPYREMEYFCKDFHEKSYRFHQGKLGYQNKEYFDIKDKKDYMWYYNNVNASYKGDKSAIYVYSNVAAREIYNFNPETKIIIMLREPVDFLHSLHSQYIRGSEENIENFEKALNKERKRKVGQENFPKNVRVPDFLFYSDWVDYLTHVKKFTKQFPSKNIKIVIFEEFVKCPEDISKDILRFLGLDKENEMEFEVKGKNKQIRFKLLRRLLANPFLLRVYKLIFSSRIHSYLKSLFLQITTVNKKRKPIDPNLKKRLKKDYYENVKELDNYLYSIGHTQKKGELLRLWGYN